ncbi:hypothetical protein EXIGLDRAFT_630413, partial [Exidia glandulosa HHB12029]
MYGEHDAYDPAEDPALRLRTVRTAASTIAESIRSEAARDDRRRRKDKGKKRSRFLGFGTARDTREDGIDVDGKKAPASGPRRLVHVAVPLGRDEVKRNGEPLTTYVRNKIRTSKYTPLTFLPKNLYEQFRRVANIYFLALVVLATQPMFGAAGSQISFLPLAVILTITAFKDGLEDYRRAAQDTELNNSPTTRLASDHNSHGGWRNRADEAVRRAWGATFVEVGDILLLRNDDQIPADVVVLATSDPQGDGLCYVETKNLDGETN